MSILVTLAWRNLTLHKLRTVLAVVSIMLGGAGYEEHRRWCPHSEGEAHDPHGHAEDIPQKDARQLAAPFAPTPGVSGSEGTGRVQCKSEQQGNEKHVHVVVRITSSGRRAPWR